MARPDAYVSTDGKVDNVSITASESNNDTIDGGTGDDTIDGGTGNDSLVGGIGDDSILGGTGNDVIAGGEGADTIDGGTDNDTIDGGDGADSILGYTGNDVIDGGAGDDIIDAGTNNDTVDGSSGSGNDSIVGFTGNDTILGGAGDDIIDGSFDDDIITGGADNDTLTGGADNDTFIYNVGDGADVITDFNAGNTGSLTDGDNTNNDFIDLTSQYDTLFELWADQNDDGILNQSNALDTKGNAVDYSDNVEFGAGESITFTGGVGDISFFTVENTGVVCFAPGTLIETTDGPRCVETLTAGDKVLTVDNGAQEIRWIHEDPQAIEGGENHPILIKAGALGVNKPTTDLIVSPQHRILVGEAGQLEPLFDAPVLVPAKSLTTLPGIREMRGKKDIVWWHFACDTHEIVIANGAKAENLLLGKMVFKGLPKPEKDALLTIFGTDMAHEGALNGKAARNLLGVGKVRKILTGQKHASDFVNAEAAKNEESSFNHARRRTA